MLFSPQTNENHINTIDTCLRASPRTAEQEFFFRVTSYLAPDFFIKSCENDTLINSYDDPEGFGKASTPAADATPATRQTRIQEPSTKKRMPEIIIIFSIFSFSYIIFSKLPS